MLKKIYFAFTSLFLSRRGTDSRTKMIVPDSALVVHSFPVVLDRVPRKLQDLGTNSNFQHGRRIVFFGVDVFLLSVISFISKVCTYFNGS